jgi:carbonic anhydrase
VLDALVEGNRRFIAGEPRPIDSIDAGKPQVAGAVPTSSAIASLALGVGLGARLIMVVGHEDCAALHRACALERDQADTSAAEAPVLRPLREALEGCDVEGPDGTVDTVVSAWVSRVASGAGIADAVARGEVHVTGAVFELPSGRLRLLGGND